MEIRLAQISVGGERYFVMYPSPAPEAGPDWLLLDADGGPVCVEETVDALRDFVPDEFVDALEAAADAAVARDAGESLEERLAVPGDSAIELAEDLGWLARMSASENVAATPIGTPLFFYGGVPYGLREQSMRCIFAATRKD